MFLGSAMLCGVALALIASSDLAHATALSQPATSHGPLQRHQIDRWYVEDGLPDNAITALVQTQDGYLWIGTGEGIVRFDGVRFEGPRGARERTTDVGEVRALAVGPDGALIVGYERTVEILPTRGAPRRYDLSSGLRDMAVDRQGQLWATTHAGLWRLAGDRFVEHSVPAGLSVPRRLHVDAQGTLWGTHGGDLVQDLSGSPRERQGPDRCAVLNFADGLDGRLWMARSCGALVLGPNGMTTIGLAQGLAHDRLRAIAPDDADRVWIGSLRGLDLVQGERVIKHLGTADGLSSADVRVLLRDREGALWVGTSDGLNRVRPTPLQTLTERDGLGNDSVRSVISDGDGGLFVGTGAGVTHLRGDGQARSWHPPAMAHGGVSALARDREGTLWVGTREEGLHRLQGDELVPTRERIRAVQSLLPDQAGGVWVSSGQGLQHLGTGVERRMGVPEGLPHEDVRVVVADGARQWVGTRRGLVMVENGRVVRTVTEADGLPDNFIRALAIDAGGDVWVGTRRGLGRIQGTQVRQYRQEHGLLDPQVRQVQVDAYGDVWLCGRRGLFRVRRDDLDALDRGKARLLTAVRYGRAGGMLGTECWGGSGPASLSMPDGRLFFSTVNGLVVVAPARLGSSLVPVPVHIERLQHAGAAVKLEGSVRVEAGAGDLVFTYAGISLMAPERVQFRYRLHGVDPDWKFAGTDRSVTYRKLRPGRYLFEVIAANADGVWNSEAARLAFQVVPPLHQRPSIIALATLTLGLLVVAVHRSRLRAARARFRAVLAERGRLAREIHDSMDQGLVGIGLQLDLADRRLEDKTSARQHIRLARQMVADSQDEAQRLVWDLRALVLERGNLVAAFAEMVKRLSSGSDRDVQFEIEGTPRELSPRVQSHLLRIGQEAVTNAVRHAGASHVAVRMTYLPEAVVLSVEDDGRGFEPGEAAAAVGHFGLVGMRERANEIGGRLHIDSAPGRGTRICVEIDAT